MAHPSDPYIPLLESYPREPRQLLPILEAIQTEHRYLPEDALRALSEYLSLPLARVYAAARFYRALSLAPKGEKLVRVCCGTACHLRGAPRLIGSLEDSLGVKLGETDKGGRFTLESVMCLGACALAPGVTIGEAVYGKLTASSVKKLPV